MIRACYRFSTLALLVMLGSSWLVTDPCSAQTRSRGILNQPAPALNVDAWVALSEGASAPDLDELKGKVVFLYCFQSWCPGCHSRGFPTLNKLINQFKDSDDVVFVAVQTAFEGHATNTPAAAIATAKRYKLDIPIGHDGGPNQPSSLMGSFRTGGTPWTIIIGKDGFVRFNDFHVAPERGAQIIEQLRSQPTSTKAHPKATEPFPTLPASRGGQDLIGSQMTRLAFDGIAETHSAPKVNADPKALQPVTVYRWWTNTCSYCEASLPALEQLRQTYEPEGVRFVGVYHPKPPRPVTVQDAAAMAKRMGYQGSIALDQDWSELRRAYLDRGKRGATSVTVVVDGQGRIRFLHPGPVFFPSEDPKHARENEDYQLLEQAIAQLVAEQASEAAQPSPEDATN